MKRTAVLPVLVLSLAALGQSQARNPAPAAEDAAAKAHPTLALGSPAPDFFLAGVDGKRHRLNEYRDTPLLAIVFTCDHCPTAQLYEGRIKALVAEYRPKGVGFVAIQPNAPAAASLHELNYTHVEDTLDGMIVRARYRHFNFAYLYDGDTQAVAQAYGPKATRTSSSSIGNASSATRAASTITSASPWSRPATPAPRSMPWWPASP